MPTNRKLLSVFAVVVFFTVLSGDTLRYGLTWYGWGAVVLVIFAISLTLVIRGRRNWRFSGLPFPLLAFLALTVLSIAWSDYRNYTIVASFLAIVTVVGALALSITFTLSELVRLLGHALRIILAGSILFELVVATLVRHPFTPWWTDYGSQKIHAAEYWSRDLLFKGGQIQGIMGNSNLLGFVALLGLIIFAIEFVSRSTRRGWSGLWVVVAILDLALTRSATVTVVAVVVAAAWIVIVLLRRARTAGGRRTVSIVSLVVVVVGAIVAVLLREPLLRVLNKSSTLTGRTGIWHEVIVLANQRPVVGWGWISYWVPDLPPFARPQFRIGGIQYLQAHDAWLDLLLQLGVVGLVVFALLALSTLVRAWLMAIDRPGLRRGPIPAFDPVTLVPVLIVVALLAQSVTESRLLIEYGLLLLSLFAIKTKRPDPVVVG